MIYELVLRNFDCSLEFVFSFSLLLLQPFNFSPVSFACNFQDWGCVVLREINFLLKIYWSIPCLHPSWKVHTWIKIRASLNHRKKTKAEGSRLIPRKHTETLVLFSVADREIESRRAMLSWNVWNVLKPEKSLLSSWDAREKKSCSHLTAEKNVDFDLQKKCRLRLVWRATKQFSGTI